MSDRLMVAGGPTIPVISQPRWPGRVAFAWLTFVLFGTAVTVTAYLVKGAPGQGFATGLLLPVAFVGALIVTHDARHPMGWIYLVSGTVLVLGAAADGDHWAWQPATATSASTVWAQAALWGLTFPLMSLALLWYPQGQLPSPRWRWVAIAAVGTLALLVAVSIAQATADLFPDQMRAPTWWDAVAARTDVLGVLVPVVAFTGVGSVLIRYRSGSREVQDSIRWVAVAAAAAIAVLVAVNAVAIATRLPQWLDQLGAAAVIVGMPVAIGLTVLRRPTFDSRLVLARSAELGVVGIVSTAAGMAVFALLAGPAAQPTVVGVCAGVTAALVGTATRRSIRSALDRRLYGERDDPLGVLSAVTRSEGLADGQLDAVTAALASSLKLTYLAIEQRDPCRPDHVVRVAAVGEAPDGGELVFPLTFEGREIGVLRVSPRSSRHPLHRDEVQLVAAVADQISSALENQRLAADAQRARERLASARGEERRRLRRELHDGLGAILTGATFHLATARRLLDDADSEAGAAVAQASADTSAAIADLRRVLEGMSPGPLEDLGLSRSVEAAARPVLTAAGVRLSMSCSEALAHPQALPAAVELAAYRIVCEAVANVARHAEARSCLVTMSVDRDHLSIRVADDGRGSGSYHRDGGLGTESSRARAIDLGGTLKIAPVHPTGTVVSAILPVRARSASDE